MLDVHLTAPFRLIQAAAPHMKDAAKAEIERHGKAAPRSIINVSSTSGTHGNAGQVNYGTVWPAAKSAPVVVLHGSVLSTLIFVLLEQLPLHSVSLMQPLFWLLYLACPPCERIGSSLSTV